MSTCNKGSRKNKKKYYFLNGSDIKASSLELNGSRKFLKNKKKLKKPYTPLPPYKSTTIKKIYIFCGFPKGVTKRLSGVVSKRG